MIRLWAFITRRPLIWLLNGSGEMDLSIMEDNPFGWKLAQRYWPYKIHTCHLLPDGTVVNSYVARWMYADKKLRYAQPIAENVIEGNFRMTKP